MKVYSSLRMAYESSEFVRYSLIFYTLVAFRVVNTQVQSDLCPSNCIERTCLNPSENYLACTYGCIDESFFGRRCSTPCPSPCLTCTRYYNQLKKCYSCVNGYYLTGSSNTCRQCPHLCISCISETNCTACSDGYYLTGSSNTCSECPHSCISCISETNCTACSHGYYLNGSSNTCTLCPHGCSSCISETNCTECSEGFYKNEFEIICECKDGLYGENCNKTCSQNCFGNKCQKHGTCTRCKSGLYGDTCMETCSKYCKDGNCFQNNGTCTDGCIENFSGDRCCSNNNFCKICPSNNFCSICVNGMFGRSCTNVCSNHCDEMECEKDTGKCKACKGSRYGPFCENECPHTCSNLPGLRLCQRESGDCIGECKNGYYGARCNKKCPVMCKELAGTTQCHKTSGECSHECKSDYYGGKCDRKCPAMCKELAGTIQCHKQSGECTDECTIGYYGHKCETKCPIRCNATNGTQVCRKESGECMEDCDFGYYGTKCDKECPQGCKDISGIRHCHRYSGECVGECQNGFYGNKCNKTCPQTCLSLKCDKVVGFCFLGCAAGYDGSFCQKEEDTTSSLSTIGIVTGVVALTVVVLLTVLQLLLLRRSYKKPPKEHTPELYDGIELQEESRPDEPYCNLDLTVKTSSSCQDESNTYIVPAYKKPPKEHTPELYDGIELQEESRPDEPYCNLDLTVKASSSCQDESNTYIVPAYKKTPKEHTPELYDGIELQEESRQEVPYCNLELTVKTSSSCQDESNTYIVPASVTPIQPSPNTEPK